MAATCTIDGCTAAPRSRGAELCEKHYYRVRRHGDPNKRLRNANGEGTAEKPGKYTRITKDGKRKQAHVAIVEAVIGRALPKGAEIHHVNEDKTDNRHENLVVCPDRAYHQLLHVRTRALDVCGDANKRHCYICGQYEDPADLFKAKGGTSFYHKDCKRKFGTTKNFINLEVPMQ